MSAQSEILVNIRAVDKATREMKAVKSEVGLLGDSIKGLGISSVLGYTSAGMALGAFVKGGIREFSQMEKANAQLNATLTSTGGVAGVTAEHADKLSASLMKMSSVDDEVVKSAEAVMLTFTNVRNTGIDHTFDDAMTAALDLSQVFGQDLQSSVVQVGKALQDPIAGVTALRRVGVQLSDAQEEQIRQFMAVNDVASAQKVILGELQREVGGSAKAFGQTMPGQIALAEQEFSNLEGQLVGHVVPAMVAVVGIAGDTAVAIGKASDAVEDAVGKIGDAWDLLPGPIQDATVKTMQFAAVLSMPVLAVGAAGIKGVAAAIDAVSDSEDNLQSKDTILSAMGSMIRTLTQDTDEWSRAIGESSQRLGAAPQAAMGIRDSLQGITDDAYKARDAADKARQSFYDLLHQPSQERQQRELGLAQAQFNVGRLDQQRAKGPLSPDNEAWYQWLVNTFIPAQEEWLNLDSLRVDRDEKAAQLAERTTGNYRDLDQAIRGQLTPGLTDLNSGLYDTKDAMQGLKNVTPQDLKVGLTGPTPTVPTKAAQIRKDFRGETPGMFGVGLDTPSVPTAAQRLRTGFRGETPAQFGVGLNPSFEVPTTAQRWRTGFRGETPAEFGVGLVETPTVPTKAQRLRSGFRGETPAEFGVGLGDPDVPGTAEGIRKEFRGETPASMAVGTYGLDNKATVQAVIANIKDWWKVLIGGGGLGVAASEQTAAITLAASGFPGWRPHNEQGVAMPSFFTASGGSTVMVGPVILNGIDIASPTGAAKFVDAIWPALRERMRAG